MASGIGLGRGEDQGPLMYSSQLAMVTIAIIHVPPCAEHAYVILETTPPPKSQAIMASGL